VVGRSPAAQALAQLFSAPLRAAGSKATLVLGSDLTPQTE